MKIFNIHIEILISISAITTFASCSSASLETRPEPLKSSSASNNLSPVPSPIPRAAATAIVMSSPTFSFQTRVTGATCQGLFVAEAHFLSPRHCFDNAVAGKKVDLVVEKSAVTATFTAIIKAPSTEVEDVALLTAGARHFRSTKAFNPNAFELPEKIFPPFPLTLNDGRVADPLVCSPLRYNVGGLVAYDCPTTGSMSGAVLMSSNSKPFAIHIGRKSGLGYALVLGSIKNELTGALGMSGRLETEGHK